MNYLETDIWTTPAEAIVIPINCVGIMGKGLALQCKQRHFSAFQLYETMCQDGIIKIGETCVIGTEQKPLILCPTKQHWKQPSVFGHVRKGVESIIANNIFWSFYSIAFPKLGCGEGKLDWEQWQDGFLYEYCVKHLFESYADDFNCDVFVHI